MRILIVSPTGPGSLGLNYADAFRALGHEVHTWNYRAHAQYGKQGLGPVTARVAKALFPHLMTRAGTALEDTCRALEPDLALVMKGELFRPDAVRAAGAHADVLAVYHGDAPWGAKGSDAISLALGAYDHVFTYDSGHVDGIRARGQEAVTYLPFAANATHHRPVASATERGSDFVFIGHRRERGSSLAALLHATRGLGSLHVHGAGWHAGTLPDHAVLHPPVGVHAHAATYAASRIALNATDYQSVNGANMRLFEATASGAALLTDAPADTSAHFTPDEEIVTYASPRDARAKLQALLAMDPGERHTLGKRAAERARREHTYEHRAKRMLRVLGLKETEPRSPAASHATSTSR